MISSGQICRVHLFVIYFLLSIASYSAPGVIQFLRFIGDRGLDLSFSSRGFVII